MHSERIRCAEGQSTPVSMCHISQRTNEGCHFPITLNLPLQSSQYARQKQSITEKQDSCEICLSLCSHCPLTERTDILKYYFPSEFNFTLLCNKSRYFYTLFWSIQWMPILVTIDLKHRLCNTDEGRIGLK